jgi:hypothetical protein
MIETMQSLTPADVTIRRFEEPDAGPVRALFITVNRLLSPPDMRAAFEDYIARSLAEEMDRVSAYYTERGGGSWVAIRADTVIGMFGLEPATTDAMSWRQEALRAAKENRPANYQGR